MVARYLIENNNSEFVDFHMELTTDTEVFKSTLKNLIKELRSFKEEESKRLHEEILKVIYHLHLILSMGIKSNLILFFIDCRLILLNS